MAAVVSPIAADRDVNALTAKHRAAIDDLKAKTQAFMPEARQDGDPWDGEWLVYDDLVRELQESKRVWAAVTAMRQREGPTRLPIFGGWQGVRPDSAPSRRSLTVVLKPDSCCHTHNPIPRSTIH